MESGTAPAYSAPPIEANFLKRSQSIVLSRRDTELLINADPCYKKLKDRETTLLNTPVPTDQQMTEAWNNLRQALWTWVSLKHREEEVRSLLEETRARMRHRRNELIQAATYRKLYLIRKKLGNKFLKLMTPLTGRPPELSSPRTTAPVPSDLLTETSSSPPPPSE